MRTAYLDCIGGISGDMALGALIDAGVDVEALLAGLRTMDLPPWELQVNRAWKSGIAATTVEVVVGGQAAGDAPLLRLPPADAPAASAGHTHSHHTHSHQDHSHEHTHSEPARPEHSHTHHGPSHTSTFAEVAGLIRHSDLPEPVRERATRVYRRLAEAEAAVHGASLETVHFHEVGAVDSIVDVVGAVYGLHLLGVERVIASPLPTGHGFVRCAHGLMPIPPPATAELLKGCPLRPVDIEGELVTPTGAALVAALAEEFGPLPAFTIREVGYGAGRKEFPFPNLLRVVIGETSSQPQEATTVLLLEANIDDQSPQLWEEAMNALLQAGALDVWLTPIQMKKARPAITLSVLCRPADSERLTRVIFRETTTLGVRHSQWNRTCLDREWIEVQTPWGAVRVKVGRHQGELRTATPEFEECRQRARAAGVSVKEVQAAAAAAAWQALHPHGTKNET